MTDSIRLVNLSKNYGEEKILDGLNLAFPLASLSIVRGCSGIGKTTLLRILAGLSSADGGQIIWPEAFVPRISMQFQEERLLDHLSARANIKLFSKSEDNEIYQALKELNLPLEEKPVCELSGGMRRRVSLARAVLSKHNLLLLDEPFSALDEKAQQLAYTFIMKNHRQQENTVILVSHLIPEGAKLKTEQIFYLS